MAIHLVDGFAMFKLEMLTEDGDKYITQRGCANAIARLPPSEHE
jgi:hypothetical protein